MIVARVINIIIVLFWEFLTQVLADGFSFFSDKFPQVYWALLSILAYLNNAVVWMVSTCPLVPTSSSSFTNPLVTVPCVSIFIGISDFYNYYTSSKFSHQLQLVVLHRSLSDNKCLEIFRTLLSIQANLYSNGICIVLILMIWDYS